MHYDSSGVVVGVWVGRNLWRLVRPRRGDACGCRRTFLKGVGYTPPLTALLRTGGNPRTSPGSSGVIVASFLKVLLGTRRFGCWERGGTSPEGAAVAGHLRFVDLPLLAFVSLPFFFVFLWACLCCGPSTYRWMYRWLLCNTKQGETLFRNSVEKDRDANEDVIAIVAKSPGDAAVLGVVAKAFFGHA